MGPRPWRGRQLIGSPSFHDWYMGLIIDLRNDPMDLWNDPRTQLHLDNSSDLRNDPRIYIYKNIYKQCTADLDSYSQPVSNIPWPWPSGSNENRRAKWHWVMRYSPGWNAIGPGEVDHRWRFSNKHQLDGILMGFWRFVRWFHKA